MYFIYEVLANVNWSLVLLFISFLPIFNFIKYNDPNPKVTLIFEGKKPQLILTYEYYEIETNPGE